MESTGMFCLVCTTSINETNLGIDVCRACAAFFKRTIKSKRSFICRQGKGQCEFRKNEKFTCRSCRFDRCVEIGMNFGVEESIIDRVKREYTLSVNRRLRQEMIMAKNLNLKKYSNHEDLFMCNIDFFYRIYSIIFTELMGILRCVIPRFDELPMHLKGSLCKNLIGKFNALEYYYRSQGKFKQMDGVCLCSLITVFDIESIQEWVEVEGVTRKDDFKESMRSFADDYMEIFDRILRRSDITEKEFHAMIVILVCQLDTTISFPDSIQHEIDETRTKIFVELQSYYRDEMGLVDFSSRLGSVMSLSTAFSELHRNSEDQLRLYSTIFDIRSQDELLRAGLNEMREER